MRWPNFKVSILRKGMSSFYYMARVKLLHLEEKENIVFVQLKARKFLLNCSYSISQEF